MLQMEPLYISVNFTGVIFLFYERKSKRWVKFEKETFI